MLVCSWGRSILTKRGCQSEDSRFFSVREEERARLAPLIALLPFDVNRGGAFFDSIPEERLILERKIENCHGQCNSAHSFLYVLFRVLGTRFLSMTMVLQAPLGVSKIRQAEYPC